MFLMVKLCLYLPLFLSLVVDFDCFLERAQVLTSSYPSSSKKKNALDWNKLEAELKEEVMTSLLSYFYI